MSLLTRAAALAGSLPVRILITVGLLSLIAASIDWGTVSNALSDARWSLFAASIAMALVGFAIASARWQRLLDAGGIRVSFRAALRAYVIGAFANNALPSGYGGDAVRAWIVGGRGRTLARALASVVVDRVSALFCLLVLAWLAVLVERDSIPGEIVALLGVGTALVGIAGLAGLVIARRRGLGRFLPAAARPWTAEVANVLRAYERDRGLILAVFVLGLAYQAVVLTGFWLVAEALRLEIGLAELGVVVPPALIAAVLPISVAGFGVREGAFVVLLAEFGVSAADAALLSVLGVVSMAIASLPGGIALALGRRSAGGGAVPGRGSAGPE